MEQADRQWYLQGHDDSESHQRRNGLTAATGTAEAVFFGGSPAAHGGAHPADDSAGSTTANAFPDATTNSYICAKTPKYVIS